MHRALGAARDGWDELGLDLAGRLAKIREHNRVFKVMEARV